MRIEGYLEKTVELRYPIIMDGEKFTQVILREAGGRDEEALSKDDVYKKDATLSLTFTIHRCIAEVVGAKRLPNVEEIGELPYGVLESMGVEIRRLTLGDEYKVVGTCPHCNKHVEYAIATDDFLVNTKLEYPEKILPLRRGIVKNGKSLKNCKLRPFNAFAMKALSQLSEEEFNNPVTNSELVLTMVESFDDVVPTIEDIKDLTQIDRKAIFSAMDIQKFVNTVLPFECDNCHKEIDLRVWVFDFL